MSRRFVTLDRSLSWVHDWMTYDVSSKRTVNNHSLNGLRSWSECTVRVCARLTIVYVSMNEGGIRHSTGANQETMLFNEGTGGLTH